MQYSLVFYFEYEHKLSQNKVLFPSKSTQVLLKSGKKWKEPILYDSHFQFYIVIYEATDGFSEMLKYFWKKDFLKVDFLNTNIVGISKKGKNK